MHEKVLGVLTDDKLTFKDHVYVCVKKASQVYILTDVHNFENKVSINLYTNYTRHFPAYNIDFYSLHFLEQIDALEHV